eukprot:49499-Pyramimonas_sp.AAC.1
MLKNTDCFLKNSQERGRRHLLLKTLGPKPCVWYVFVALDFEILKPSRCSKDVGMRARRRARALRPLFCKG